ncbi:MAG: hypothetical protein ABIR34_04090, partial [Marmoricola sp.]
GPPQTATGTDSWTRDLDTTGLTNGTHTLTATATDSTNDTGTTNLNLTVQNSAPVNSCQPPAGTAELSANVSLESTMTGWTGIYHANSLNTRVAPAGGSFDRVWALRVAPKKAGAAGANNVAPIWVPGPPGRSTTASQVYTGSAWVRAGSAGEKISLVVREATSSGTTVASHTTTLTPNDTAWHQMTSTYTAAGSGHVIRYSLYANNFKSSSQFFLADCLSLHTP